MANSAQDPEKGNQPLVLVAEDDAAIRKLVGVLLLRAGMRMLGTVDAEMALTTGRQHLHQLALAILDQDMPGGSGLEVAMTLRQERPNLPVVIMSGYEKQRLVADGLDDSLIMLSKPFTPDHFDHVINSVISD